MLCAGACLQRRNAEPRRPSQNAGSVGPCSRGEICPNTGLPRLCSRTGSRRFPPRRGRRLSIDPAGFPDGTLCFSQLAPSQLHSLSQNREFFSV